ncbi:MAG TPA: AI-2E family transporter [Thermoleophilaceae bacterium]|nr:AI-2E family transporter [Actinomycetota bacterium]HYN51718.1 AI-2E family transporter [Thermoleophilaceae bacterium]
MSTTPVPRSAQEGQDRPSVRATLRVVVTVVLSALALYLLYLVRTPVGYILLGAFVAIAASGPVNLLSRKLPRGLALVTVYLGIIFLPIIIALILVPPAVEQGIKLANKLPSYAQDLNEAFDENPQLKEANEKYDITSKLENVAENLVSRIGDAAGALVGIGAGLVSSIFALVTILVISMFLIGRGKAWRDAALRHRPADQAARITKATNEIADAVGSYIGGALAQATVAGAAAWLMLVILGVPSPLPLALIIALLDLIPLVGATLGAVVVGVVTLFVGFPTTTIIWAVFAIAYQQFENYVVQPRIQSRAVALDPFLIVVAALFGGALLGVIGALLSIPTAAAIQIAVREWLEFRRESRRLAEAGAP